MAWAIRLRSATCAAHEGLDEFTQTCGRDDAACVCDDEAHALILSCNGYVDRAAVGIVFDDVGDEISDRSPLQHGVTHHERRWDEVYVDDQTAAKILSSDIEDGFHDRLLPRYNLMIYRSMDDLGEVKKSIHHVEIASVGDEDARCCGA